MEKVTYPFPLRPGCLVKIQLPVDLTRDEVDRLTTFLSTLAPPASPAPYHLTVNPRTGTDDD